MNYYNEHDPKAAAWLRALIDSGLIPAGDVDERGIEEVRPEDLRGYSQCHFFAGIGGWSYALQLAGWPADRPVWTGSCPCQPFSVAGKGRGVEDERHLWPVFAELIRACQPPTVFGEQVASKAGRDWLAGVFTDLEGMGYSRAGADLCAAGVGAPHIRQRLFWVADSNEQQQHWSGHGRPGRRIEPANCGYDSRLADSNNKGLEERQEQSAREERQAIERSGDAGWVDNSTSARRDREEQDAETETRDQTWMRLPCASGWHNSFPIMCRDGKTRRIPSEPALFPLADGLPGRVGLLRGAGNAIVPQVAAEFIAALLDCRA